MKSKNKYLILLTTALTAVENKIPNVSNLVKKTDYKKKINEIKNEITTNYDHDKYITTQEFNKITSENFTARLKQANLVKKNDITNFVKKTDFDDKQKKLNKKVFSNKTKHVEAEKKITDLTKKVVQISEKAYDFLLGRMYFTGNDGFQNVLVFAPMLSSLVFGSNKKVTTWISTEIPSEKIKPFDTNLEQTMSNLVNGRVKLKC